VVDTQKTEESATADPQKRSASCTHHCRSCDRHFSSIASFDAHRVGEFEPESIIEGRRCLGIEFQGEKIRQRFKSRPGFCQLQFHGERLIDVPVWGSSQELPKGIHA